MKKIVSFFIFFLLSAVLYAQQSTDQQLAQYYYSSGDFVKAMNYCEREFNKENNKFNFTRYYVCLIKNERTKEAEKLLKKQINKAPEIIEYRLLLIDFYEQQKELKLSKKLSEELIEENSTSPETVIELYKEFKAKGKTSQNLELLEKARKKLKLSYPLNLQFADYYFSNNQKEKAMIELLDLIDIQPEFILNIKSALSSYFDFENTNDPSVEQLKEELIDRAQKRKSELIHSEMLLWFYTQQKQFEFALNFAQSMDKRFNESGNRVFELCTVLLENKHFELARKGFRYITELSKENYLYFVAEQNYLTSYYQEVTFTRNLTNEKIASVINEYEASLTKLGSTKNTISSIIELAYLYGFYAHNSTKGIELLQSALKIPGLSGVQLAETKMLLADLYVVKDEIWEASLLYMQIDTDFKFETIGSEAKFKNARIFYYDGDFKFAQTQLDVLKESTSKFIANDALKLSLLITDNYGLDSNYTAMRQFAKADLLLEQRQYDEAFILYDSIMGAFPYHGLNDEILLRKSLAFQQQGKWNEAITYLDRLLATYAQDILADDALYQLGNIYENHLNNPQKASENYKKILFEYKGSLYGVEARKRLRTLRGDKTLEPTDSNE
jgi:tetratricopeptide (TPR) repeat protein